MTSCDRWTRWSTASALAAALAVGGPAAAARADTSTASASPLSVTTSLGVTVAAGTDRASSDGSAEDRSTPAVSALGGQSLVTAGLVASDVVARADGTSAACAGLVGSGGSVRVGADGSCTTTSGSGGVRIELTPLITLTATAITSGCTAKSTGPSTTRTTIVGGRLNGTSFDTGASGSLLGLVDLDTGAASTSTAGAGPASTTALAVKVLGATTAVRIGSVTCGQNAVVVPTPALPLAGWPIALAGAAVVAGTARRHLCAPTSTSPSTSPSTPEAGAVA